MTRSDAASGDSDCRQDGRRTSDRRRRRGPARRRRWVGPAIASGLAMVAAAIAALVLTGMQDNAIYSKPVDQLLAQKAKFVGRPVRAEGNLVHGSLDEARRSRASTASRSRRTAPSCPVRFAQCVVPDTFRDVPDIDVGVTVEGELQSDDSFEATSVLAKCPSKYEMKQRKDTASRCPTARSPPRGSRAATVARRGPAAGAGARRASTALW